jgi:hypothetical protein
MYAKPATQHATDIPKASSCWPAGFPDGKGLEVSRSFKLAFVAERESYLGPIATVISRR